MSENTSSGGDIPRLLEQVRDGRMTAQQAAERLRDLPYQDLGYARIDHHRPLRTGSPEVVLGQGKTPQQVAGIVAALRGRGHPVLVTRAGWDAYAAVLEVAPEAGVPRTRRGHRLTIEAGRPKNSGNIGRHRWHRRPPRGGRGPSDGAIDGPGT